MSLAHPWLLLLLPLIPLVWVAWLFGSARSLRRAKRLSRVPVSGPAVFASLFFMAAAASALLAAAQPRWGETDAFIPRRGADLFVVLDVSRSMGARDVAPTRLEAAKTTIIETYSRLGGDRAGLVIFAGDAVIRAPLTSDLDAASRIVTTLEPGPILVDGGSSAASGLDLALSSFDSESEAGRLVLLLTDGDDLGDDPAATAARFSASNVTLLIAGLGTPDGATVPIVDPETGDAVDLVDASGVPVITRLNEPLLQAMAAASGGQYLGSNLAAVPAVVTSRMSGLATAQFDERETTIPIERAQWFAGAAAALVLLGALFERFRPRKRARLALAAMLPLLLGACATEGYNANRDGLEAFQAGDFELAEEYFLQAQAAEADDPAVALNVAAALHAQGRFEEASVAARRAISSTSPRWRAQAYASIGHHRAALGDLVGSLDAFRQSLLEFPDDATTRRDYEIVYRLLNPPPEEETPEPGATPTPEPGQGSPEPGATGTPEPGEGDGEPGEGTPGPGAPGTPEPGEDGGSLSDDEIEQRLAALDQQIATLYEEAGDEPTAAQAFEILVLLAERSRIAALENPDGSSPDPLDY